MRNLICYVSKAEINPVALLYLNRLALNYPLSYKKIGNSRQSDAMRDKYALCGLCQDRQIFSTQKNLKMACHYALRVKISQSFSKAFLNVLLQ